MKRFMHIVMISALWLTGCTQDTVKRATYNSLKINKCRQIDTLVPPDCYRSYDQEYDADQKALRDYEESLRPDHPGQ